MSVVKTYMTSHEQDGHRKPIATDPRVKPVALECSAWLKVYFRCLPSVSALFRRRRMIKFVEILKIKPGTKVLDLGGSPGIWE